MGFVDMVAKVAGCVGSFFNWKSSPVQQSRSAKSDVARERRAERERREAINDAVWGGDEQEVNRIVQNLGIILGVFLSATWMAGCLAESQKMVMVPADRYVACMTNATGAVVYWKVPPAVMEEFLVQKEKIKKLEDKLEIKERTTK